MIASGQPAPHDSAAFEVAAVKRASRQPGRRLIRRLDDAMFQYAPISMRNLIRLAYGVKIYQISGPEWIKTNVYDISAKIPNGRSRADIPAMLRNLLAERFRLVVRREPKPTEVYALEVAKAGLNLRPCKAVEGEQPKSIADKIVGLYALKPDECPQDRTLTKGEESILVETSTMDVLARALQDGTDRPVLNETGIEGRFQIAFECSQLVNSADGGGSDLPSMPTALAKLGLKLVPRREEIEHLIIVSGDQDPAGN